MKYDVLKRYRSFLNGGECEVQTSTAQKYYERMGQLLQGQYLIRDGKEIDISKVLDELSKIKYKNHFSQAKNALTYFCDCFGVALTAEQLWEIKKLEEHTKKKYRKLSASEYKKIKATIVRLKNKKLKQSYMVLIATGLRVSELTQIRAKDCIIFDDKIQFSFVGKGGSLENAYLYKDDSNFYQDFEYSLKCRFNENNEKKLFYSTVYLQRKAKQYGFCCHDLRRAFAKIEYKKTKSKEAVKEKLRHTKIKTTNLYLKSPIKID